MDDGPKRVRVYIDGFNLYYGGTDHAELHRKETGMSPQWKWLDLFKVALRAIHRLWPAAELEHLYYFTAPVQKRFAGDLADERQDAYIRALIHLGVDVRRGTFRLDAEQKYLLVGPILVGSETPDPRSLAPGRDKSWVQIVEEKGSDVNLATRVLVDYFTEAHAFDATVVVSNDSDLRAPIEYLWDSGWPTIVLNPHPGYSALYRQRKDGEEFGTRLTLDDMISCQLTDPMADPHGTPILSKRGNPIRKPPSW